MANTLTTTSNFSSAKVDRWFGSRLLEIGEQDVIAERFALKAKIPKGQGAPTASWLRYSKLDLAQGTLTEGTAPTADAMAITRTNVSCSDYGQVLAFSDKLLRETNHDVAPIAVDLLGESMMKLREKILYDALEDCSNVIYSGSSNTARGDLAVGDVIDSQDILSALATLEHGTNTRGRAPRFSSGPASGKYAALIHPAVMFDLRQDATFNNSLVQQDIEELRQNRNLSGQVFDWQGVRFFVTNFMPEYESLGTFDANTRGDGLDNIAETDDSGGSLADDTYYYTVVVKHTTRLFSEMISAEASVAVSQSNAGELNFVPGTTVANYVFDVYVGTVAGTTYLQSSNNDVSTATTVTIQSVDTSTATAPVVPGTAGTTGKVYATYIFGEEAYGAVDVETSLLDAGFVPRGRSFNDPLHQLNKAGWKMSYAALILDDLKLVRIESVSAFSK